MPPCENCGSDMPKGYLICPSCGHKAGIAVSARPAQAPLPTPLKVTPTPQTQSQAPQTQPQAPQTHPLRLQVGAQYAGFWVRFAAHLIDVIILWAVLGTLYIFFSLAAGEAGSVVALSLYAFISLFYEGYFLSRNWFATPGKKAMKLQVLDESHQHISFGVAMGRSLLKFVSAITFGIGYLMVAFTDKKQGLHDFMVKTVVIRV